MQDTKHDISLTTWKNQYEDELPNWIPSKYHDFLIGHPYDMVSVLGNNRFRTPPTETNLASLRPSPILLTTTPTIEPYIPKSEMRCWQDPLKLFIALNTGARPMNTLFIEKKDREAHLITTYNLMNICKDLIHKKAREDSTPAETRVKYRYVIRIWGNGKSTPSSSTGHATATPRSPKR